MLKKLFIILFLFLPFYILSQYIWTGAQAVKNWNDPGNWVGGPQYPGFSPLDTASINGAPTAILNVPITIASLSVSGGALDLAGNTLTTSSDVTMTGGTISNATGAAIPTLNIGGNLSLSNGGTLDIQAGNGVADLIVSGNITISGAGTAGNLTIRNETLDVYGNFDAQTNSLFYKSGSTVNFDGNTDTTLFNNADPGGTPALNNFDGMSVNKGAGHKVTMLSDLNVNASGAPIQTLTVIAGATLDCSTFNVTIGTGGTGTLVNSGTIRLQGTQTLTFNAAATTAVGNGGTFEYYNANNTTLHFTNYFNLLISGGNRAAGGGAGSSSNIGGTLQLTGGQYNFTGTQTLTVTGTTNNAGSITSVNGFMTFTGAVTNSGTISTSGGSLLTFTNGVADNGTVTGNTGGITVSASGVSGSGTFNCGSGTVGITGDVTVSTFHGNSATITINNNVNNTNFTESSVTTTVNQGFTTGTLTAAGGTVTLNNTFNLSVGAGSFNNLTINTGNRSMQSDITVNNNLTINNGAVLTTGANNLSCNNLIENGTGTLDASGQGAGNTLTISANATGNAGGTLKGGGGTIGITGNLNISNVTASSGNTTLGGNLTVPTANFNANGGTFIFNGNTTVNQDLTFNNIQINGGDTLNITGRNITINGNWDNSAGGTLTSGGSTVTFAPSGASSTISGSTTFNNFTCTGAGGKTLNFQAGTMQTIANFTVSGLAGPPVNFLTLTGSATWYTKAASSTVNYVNVSNANATSFDITANTSKDGGGNNVGSPANKWIFSSTTIIWNVATCTTDWFTGSNWNLGYVPNSTDNIQINFISAGQQPLLTGAVTTNNLTIFGAASFMDCAGKALTVNGAFANGGTLRVNGNEALAFATPANVWASGTFEYYASTTTVHYNHYYNLQINTGTFSTLAGATTIDNNLTITAGTLDIAGNIINITGTLSNSNSGTLRRNAGNLCNKTDATQGLVVYYGAAGNIQKYGANDYFNLEIQGGATFSTTAVLNLSSNLTITSGTLNIGGFDLNVIGQISAAGQTLTSTGGNIFVGTNWNVGTFNNGSDIVTFNGGVGGTINATTFYNLTVSGTGTWTTTGLLTINGTFTESNGILNLGANVTANGSFSQSGGTINVGTNTLAINSTVTTPSLTAGAINISTGTLDLSGMTVAGGTTFSGTNVTITGAGSIDSTGRAITDNGSTIGLGNGGANLPCQGFTLSSGTFNAGNGTITDSGDFGHSGGAFNGNTSTVNFTGAGTSNITGSTTFNSVTCAAAGKTLNLGSGNTFASCSITNVTALGGETINIGSGNTFTTFSVTSAGSGAGQNINITGNNTYTTFSVTNNTGTGTGQTISFPIGGVPNAQTVGTFILTGRSGNLITLKSSSAGTQATILTGAQTVNFVNVQDSIAANPSITANSSKNSGNNNANWIFQSVTWTGASIIINTDWNDGTNWSFGFVPGQFDNVIIANAGGQPATVTLGAVTINNLTINLGATLYTNGLDFTINGTTFTNNGTFQTNGTETLSLPAAGVSASGTMEYKGPAGGTLTFSAYNNLTVSGTGNFALNNPSTDVNGNLNIKSGTLDASGGGGRTINIAGDWNNTGGAFTNTGSTVVFNNALVTSNINNSTIFNNFSCTTPGKTINITGNNTFNNFTITTLGAGQTIQFTAATTQTINGTLTLTGGLGNIILKSSIFGIQWVIQVASPQTVTFVDVQDSNAAGNNITDVNGNDLGGNDNLQPPPHWIFGSGPNSPFISNLRVRIGDSRIYVQFNNAVIDFSNNPLTVANFTINNGPAITAFNLISPSIYTLSVTPAVFTINNIDQTIPVPPNFMTIQGNNIKDLSGNPMNNGDKYPLSCTQLTAPLPFNRVGIDFFTNVSLTSTLNTDNNWGVVTDFSGNSDIFYDGLVLTAAMNPALTGVPKVYYITADSIGNNNFYLPPLTSNIKTSVGRFDGQNWRFDISTSSDDGNKYIFFVFSIINGGNEWFCYRGLYPANDPVNFYQTGTYIAKLRRIALQNNNVTILNNVINPRNGDVTKLLYTLDKSGPVSIVVYDLNSDLVKVLVGGNQDSGDHTVTWDGKNNNNKTVTRGVYFIRVRAPGIFNQIRKVLVIK